MKLTPAKLTQADVAEHETLIDYPEIGIQLIASLNTDKDKLLENVKINIQRRELMRVWPCAPQSQDSVLAIVAGGPSLLDTLDELRDVIESGAKVVSLANATHLLLEHGITPSAQVILDAKPRNAEFLFDLPGCTYFLASQCDPSVFEKALSFSQMNGYTEVTAKENEQRVMLWNAVNNDEELEAVMNLGEAWVPVQSGSTITLRALRLFQILGYYKFHMFGFDSCMMDGKHHAYPQPMADDQRRAEITCNGRVFEGACSERNPAREAGKFV